MAQPFDPMRERLNRKPLNEKRLMSGPYWAELRIFLAVAKSRSFNRAAKTLGISQPTVSRHVHWLQDVMGSQLLVASQHGVILTDRGKELADLLISLDEKLFSISQSLGSESKEAAGVVRFSSTEAIAGLFIVPKLREFGAQHPNITLHVRNITNMLDFRENQSDIVLGFAPSEQDGIESRTVGVMHLIPYRPAPYSVKSLTAVSLCAFSVNDMIGLANATEPQIENLSSAAWKHADATSRRMMDLGHRSAIGRVSQVLVDIERRLGERGGVQDNQFYFPVRLEHLADALGLTTVYVNRTLDRLRNDGIIEFERGRMTITDPATLRKIADEE